MSEQIGGVVYDIDNTIYCHRSKQIPPLILKTLNSLEVPAMPATGRSLPLMRSIAADGVRLTSLGLLDSGATVVDFKKREVVWERWLPGDKVTEIIRKVGRQCLSLSVSTLEEKVLIKPDSINERFSYPGKSPSVFAVHPLGERTRLVNQLKEIEEIEARFMRYENSLTHGCVQVTPKGIDKGTGVLRMLDLAGLSSKKIVAVGDDYVGDGPLFKAIHALPQRGIAVAMGNADPSLKAEADMVVASVSDIPDGFTDAMRRLNLVK